MELSSYINEIIRPKIQGDGGEIEYVGETGDTVSVIFRGECSKCLILDRCVRWIEAEIQRETGKTVTVSYERKKPFFWDFA
ncbi:MAG: NifU family protein [Clostridia bacterium]|nr:NifU family protein [Clostridia bacterium]